MAMLYEYSYLNEIVVSLLENKEYIADEINLAGSRKAGKTYSIDELIALLSCVVLSNKDKKIAIYGFRLNSADTAEMQQDIQDALDKIGLILNPTKKWKGGHYQYNARFNKPTWTFPNGSFIKLQGARKSNSSQVLGKGTARANGANLCIIWLEEANEFSKSEKEAIMQAVRDYKKLILITSTNPDSIYQYHIDYLNKLIPFNRKELESKGEQISKLVIPVLDPKTGQKAYDKKVINHYTNYLINKDNLNYDELMKLYELKAEWPKKYEVWGIGMPGALDGSIFANYLFSKLYDFEPVNFKAGLDLGYADSPLGHATHAILMGLDREYKKMTPLMEYKHSNAEMIHKDTTNILYEIVHFYIMASIQWDYLQDGLDVNVDYGNGGLVSIDTLNNIRRQYYPDANWLRFKPVVKDVWYRTDRIDAIIILLNKNYLQISQRLTPELFKDMLKMEWRKPPANKSSYKLEDNKLFDDGFDAMTYAVMDIMEYFIKTLDNPFLISKQFGKRG